MNWTKVSDAAFCVILFGTVLGGIYWWWMDLIIIGLLLLILAWLWRIEQKVTKGI